MDDNRKTGILIGILYIIGTVFGILSAVLTGTMSDPHEYLVHIASNNNKYVLGACFVLCMGFSLAFIPLIIYPVLKKTNKTLALGYVIFRGALETITYIGIFVCMMLLLETGQHYLNELENIGILIYKFRDLCSLTTVYVFSIGALLFYTGLYKSKLVPKWLSLWGIIAIILHFLTGLLIMFGLQTEASVSNSIMNFPIFLQEMVMAVWLIIKGFDFKFIREKYET
jgi:hypothetical protein